MGKSEDANGDIGTSSKGKEVEDDDFSVSLNHFPPHSRAVASRLQKKRGSRKISSNCGLSINEKRLSSLALEKANVFKSDHPSFVVSLSFTSLFGKALHIPVPFCEKHVAKYHPGWVTLRIQRTKQMVSVKVHYFKKQTRLTAGWTKFVIDNKLEIGDVCVFTLTDAKTFVFDVEIIRLTDVGTSSQGDDEQRDQKPRKRRHLADEEDLASSRSGSSSAHLRQSSSNGNDRPACNLAAGDGSVHCERASASQYCRDTNRKGKKVVNTTGAGALNPNNGKVRGVLTIGQGMSLEEALNNAADHSPKSQEMDKFEDPSSAACKATCFKNVTACQDATMSNSMEFGNKNGEKEHSSSTRKVKRRKLSAFSCGYRTDSCGTQQTRVLRSRNRVQEVVTPTSTDHPCTVLSWLIDNNVVSPMEKVHYCRSKGSPSVKEGKACREGIQCNCCQRVFTLGDFESHAGCSNYRPAANIFLEDGKSLLDCQMQIKRGWRSCRPEPHDAMEGSFPRIENDSFCTVCQDGGDLILCDRCPSVFHKSCIGLEDVPDGDWFCPACCCKICGCAIEPTIQYHTCGQCERKYHTGCLRKESIDNVETDPKEYWFCSNNCEKIFLSLHKRLGKQFLAGVDNLTWSLWKWKSVKTESDFPKEPDEDAAAESHTKLSLALQVMQECFKHLKEPHTDQSLAEDIIFNRGSTRDGINFQGFYTLLLEKNDALITVATVRIYGAKVAEVPLIGTRLQHRQSGMVRVVMNLLEKMLMELGVERLVLPIVCKSVGKWNNIFGFSDIKSSDRLQFLDYRFIHFEDAIMCQKCLARTSLVEKTATRNATSFQNVTASQEQVIELSDSSTDHSLDKIFVDVYSTSPPDLMNFRGWTNMNKEFVPLLEEACSRHPSLIECQEESSPQYKEWSFTALGKVLHFLKTKKVGDMTTSDFEDLDRLYKELKTFKFDLSWLEPHVKTALAMSKFVERAAEVKRLRENVNAMEIDSKRLETKLVAARNDLKKAEESLDERIWDCELGYCL